MVSTEIALTDDAFFAALVAGDAGSLEAILTADFRIVSIADGAVLDRGSFVASVGSGGVTFAAIDVLDRQIRMRDDTAVVVGTTQMRGSIGETSFDITSRYSHVFCRDPGADWQLMSAQGTPVAGGDDGPGAAT